MQTRQARLDLTAYTKELKKRTIPANAILHDFRVGPGHEGLAQHNPDVVSFHYEGKVYFNMVHEIVGKTVVKPWCQGKVEMSYSQQSRNVLF